MTLRRCKCDPGDRVQQKEFATSIRFLVYTGQEVCFRCGRIYMNSATFGFRDHGWNKYPCVDTSTTCCVVTCSRTITQGRELCDPHLALAVRVLVANRSDSLDKLLYGRLG